MQNEIERKFNVKEMPDLYGIVPLRYERYILEYRNGVEVRISKVNNVYKWEKKVELNELERTREKKDISKDEFDTLAQSASKVIIRDKYNISINPHIAIMVYHGRFEGLIRAEVEFRSNEEAEAFRPLEWMGDEITHLPIARDGKLTHLTDEQFKTYLV